jgi:peptide/nickel transport system permease protein
VRRLGGARGLLGLLLVLAMLLGAGAGPLLAGYDADAADFAATLQPPSPAHPLGTDDLGRDVLARVLAGGRTSLAVAILGVGAAALLGVPLGLACGFLGGWLDAVAMRGVDVLLAFPGILLALGITSALGASAGTVAAAIAVVNLPVFARVARTQGAGLRTVDYVAAARAVGRTDGAILLRTVAPNALSPILVQASVLLAGAILTESYLSFLGLGVQPPTPSWGGMLRDAVGFLDQAEWLAWFPGAALFAAVLGFNLLGDGLRDGLDRRTLAP